MAHNINSMFYTGETPWHGLGTPVETELTSQEAIRKAGLNWRVTKVPVRVDFKASGKDNVSIPFDGRFITQRQDNGRPLGMVKSRYKVLQNRDAFSFFDAIVGEKAAMYHTAGALGKGERIWLLAKLPGDIVVKSVDKVEQFLLLMNSHDGSSAVTVKMTPIRVVCQNTLNAALEDGGDAARLRHSTHMGTRVGDIRQKLGIVVDLYKKLGERWEFLASRPCGIKAMESYARELLTSIERGKEAAERTKAAAIMEDVCTRFEAGKGNDLAAIKGTWWTAYNAITEHVDWSPLFSRARTADARATSLLLGHGAAVKERALIRAIDGARKG